MITKLTLSIDDAIITNAKKYAKEKGKSLSGLVENYLLSLSSNENLDEHISTRILKMMGSIELPEDFDYKKNLSNDLSKKYKL
jgi:hypothetical protein